MKKFLNWLAFGRFSFWHWIRSIKPFRWYQKLIYFILIFDIFIFCVILLGVLKKNALWAFLCLWVLYLFVRLLLWRNNLFLKKKTSQNCFIFGPQGSGKDTLMQLSVIKKYIGWFNRNRPKPLANVNYGYGTEIEKPQKMFDLFPNTYRNLIEDTITTIQKHDEWEGRDYYFTDSAIYFPSHEDNALNKQYPSFPIAYALRRQLYGACTILNTQVNGRLWIKLREQVQDGYIEALGCIGWGWFWSSIPFIRNFVLIRCRYYSKLQSAEMGLLPFNKVAILNNVLDKSVYMTSAGATKEMYDATNGEIRELVCLLEKRHVKFESRIFHEKIFGKKAL